MYEFQCGSPVCDTRFAAATREQLMLEVTRHIQEDHHIPHPTRPIMDFLAENTISEVHPPKRSAG